MKTIKRLINDIQKFRKYIIYSTKVELQAEVTNAYLDWIWWVLDPILSMLVYYLIFGFVFKAKEEYYLVFIYSAQTMWGFFNRSVTSSVKLIKSHKSIISRVYIPKIIILISKMGVFAFKMAISSLIVVLLMLPYRIRVDYHILGLVPVLIVFFVFCYGCSAFLTHIGVFVEDMTYVITIGLRLLFYFTGVFYSVGKRFPAPYGAILERVNPLAFFIAQMRNALMYRSSVSYGWLAVWLCISLAMAVAGSNIIYKNENNYVKVI